MVETIGSYGQYNPAFGNSNAGFYNGVKATSAGNDDVKNIARFLTGQKPVEEGEETMSQCIKGTLPLIPIFGALSAFPFVKKNFMHPIKGIKDYNTANPLKNGNNALIKNGVDVFNEKKKLLFSTLTPAEKAALQADRGFLGKGLDLIPGYKKLRATGFGQFMGKSGAGWMIVMDGGIRLFTDIVPTFKQLGAGAGIKQIAKTGTEVVAGAAGWTAGEIAGSAAGAALGAFGGPAGMVAGKFIGGFLGGTIGMWLAHKAAKSITGKSEIQKNNEAQGEMVEQAVKTDPEAEIALYQAALQQADAVLAQEPDNKEALEIKQAVQEKLLAYTQQAQEEALKDSSVNQTPVQSNNNFGAMTGLAIPPVPGFQGLNYDLNEYSQGLSKAKMPNLNKMYQYQQMQSNAIG